MNFVISNVFSVRTHLTQFAAILLNTILHYVLNRVSVTNFDY